MIFLLPVEVQGIASLTLSTTATGEAESQAAKWAARMDLQQHQRENPSIDTDYIVD